MRRCRATFMDDWLKKTFDRLGRAIGEQPGYFLIVPILLSALCASGFQRVKFMADPEYLFSPTDGEAKHERAMLEHHFPNNFTAFDPSRSSKAGRFGRLLITAADGGSLLRTHVWREIDFLDQVVQNLTLEWEGSQYDYQQMCALRIDGYCWDNEALDLGVFIDQIERREINLTYPIWFNPTTYKGYGPFPMYFGGISVSNVTNTIESVEALSLTYFLDAQEPWMVERGSAWEALFLASMEAQDLSNIVVDRFSSLTLEQELEENTNSVIPYFSLNIGIMIVFCIVTCMMTDWVKSKPMLGLFGVISAILASISAFGCVMYFGMDFIGINLAAPFLMLGIGIDDTFVLLAAWRRTSIHDSVPARLGATYKEAGISITITSVTDMLSFWVGVITPFPCVQIFCIYTGTCVIFTYVWHITFFGGCMAVAGYAESQNRHALSCCVVLPKSQSGSKGFLYSLFCSGGINHDDPWNPKDNKENGMMKFFRDYIGEWLCKPWAKALVLTVFVTYIGVACWGVIGLQEGLEKKRLSRFDSYSVEYYNTEEKYFMEYPFRINVVVSGVVDYSDKKVQKEMEELLRGLENTTFIDPLYTESWLRSFLDYVGRWGEYEEYDKLKVEDEQSFITALRDVYIGSTPYVQDIHFSQDEDGQSHIEGARFILQSWNVRNSSAEAQLVRELRAICHQSPYNVTVFNPYFIYFDQFLGVVPNTIQCVGLAALIMLIVSLVFIPNPICSLWVAFAIMSIEFGVLGFMAFWGINLDAISMINLIMSIGFSVDFAAHISYSYMDSDGSPNDRVRNSLYSLGLPICQGAISTILGVIGLMIAPSYIFVTFFKMVFLVIILGALHGLFLLPVLLSLFGPGSCSKVETEEKCKTKSPTTSYLSDGESATPVPAKLHEVGDESEMRIPRPTSHTNHHNHHSSHHTDRREHRRGKREHQVHEMYNNNNNKAIHEMYHNNGYLSEEDQSREEEVRGVDGANLHMPGPHPWSGASWGVRGPVRYYQGPPGYLGGPPYVYPLDYSGGHSGPSSRHHSKDRRSKSHMKSDCRKKKPKH